MKWIEIIFIYCILVSTRWQWSVDWYDKTKNTAQKEKQYTKNTRTQNTQNRKNSKQKTNIKRILKKVSRVIWKSQKEANNDTWYDMVYLLTAIGLIPTSSRIANC